MFSCASVFEVVLQSDPPSRCGPARADL